MNWTEFASNPWVGFVGTLFGIIGVVLSITLYIRSRRLRRPTYYIRSIRWFDGNEVPHNELTLMFRGHPISGFTITHIAFWNGGNEMFRASDFAQSSPLRLHIPDNFELFDVRIAASTSTEIGVKLNGPMALPAGVPKEIPIQFDYLDPGDGFKLQVIHDGHPSQGIDLVGKLPGAPEFRHVPAASSLPLWAKWFFLPLFFIALGSLGPISLYYAFFREFHWYHILGFICTIYLAFPILMWREPVLPRKLWGKERTDENDD